MPLHLGDNEHNAIEACIHELFEQQVARTPDATALSCEDHTITYAELNLRTNQLAHHLRKHGIGVEKLVGVCLERSIDAVVGLIATLKAGGAYVYLDPSYPSQRLREMAEDAQVSLIVSNSALRARIFDDTGRFLCLDVSRNAICAEAVTHIDSGVTPENAAYVIYTSGSTGKPKGTVEIHQSMTNRLVAPPLPDIQATDVCCLSSSLGFGISASRLFLPLVCGSLVVIMTEDQVRDVKRFVELLDANKVTSAFMVPALLRQVLSLESQSPSPLVDLRAVTVSGGALTRELATLFFMIFPRAILINNYGSSEIGSCATMKILSAYSDLDHISIGQPVVNTRVYVLDDNRNEVPRGSRGEIYVAATHLARGYLNMPRLTSETFIPNLIDDTYKRMCRTGDVGRYLENGDLELLGRMDRQIKLRGFRIDPEEIEAALESNPRVSEAAVAAYDGGSDKQLVAYVRSDKYGRQAVRELRAYLSRRLPDHMVPSLFVFLDTFPHTDAGKIDRTALPNFDQCRPEVDSPYESPRDAIESVLARIWSDVLDIEIVGINDNFVALGGDSLAATEVLSLMEIELQTKVMLQVLFDETLKGVADAIRNARGLATLCCHGDAPTDNGRRT